MKLSPTSGFSLTELLIVVAVVAVLSVLTFGAMQGLADRRDVQICQNNLRQVYTLLHTYTADHAGRFPPALSDAYGDVTRHWRRAILPYMGLKATGEGPGADVFNTGLVCPAMNRSPLASPEFSRICNFGLNENISDPDAPLERGIPVARIRKPSRFFLATESVFANHGLPREAIKPKDFNTFATRWNYHQNNRYQSVLFGDGHIEFFPNVRRLIMTPYAVGKPEDVWTP